MNESLEEALNIFLRTYKEIFTVKSVMDFLAYFDCKVSKQEIIKFIESNEKVFVLEKNMYITRAGAFSDMYFSFTLLQQEIDQGVFVPGDRLMPFVDNDCLSCSYTFEYNHKMLSHKIFETDPSTAKSLFILYGEEYSAQYIAADPINEDLNLVNNNFELPPHVQLTGISLSEIQKDFKLKKGDRILCKVVDWNKGIIRIQPLADNKEKKLQYEEKDILLQQWNELLETSILNSLKCIGPCNSIEQQLSFVFYEYRKELCTKDCGSIHEFLDYTKKVGIESFGVETRIWKKGEDVPAIGDWNRDFHYDQTDCNQVIKLPDYVLDCYLKDFLYDKKNDIEMHLEEIFPVFNTMSDKDKKVLTLQIISRNDILRERYNWFADFSVGLIRKRILKLYEKVRFLVSEVEVLGKKMESLPQQELVTLSQLFTHILKLLELLSLDYEVSSEEKSAIELSIEGMECNFEDVKFQLKKAIDKYQAEQFKVI